MTVRAARPDQRFDLSVTSWSTTRRCLVGDGRPCRLRLDPGLATLAFDGGEQRGVLVPNAGAELIIDYDSRFGMKLAGLLETAFGGLGVASILQGLEVRFPCAHGDLRCSALLVDSGFFLGIFGLGLGIPTTILGFTLAGPRVQVRELEAPTRAAAPVAPAGF